MAIKVVQLAGTLNSTPAALLSVNVPVPVTVGDTILAYVRYTGTTPPSLADKFGNDIALVQAVAGTSVSVAFYLGQLKQGGAGNTITATSAPGQQQILELVPMELSVFQPSLGKNPLGLDLLLALTVKIEESNGYLQRLCNAERA